jgi:hypothetical protein
MTSSQHVSAFVFQQRLKHRQAHRRKNYQSYCDMDRQNRKVILYLIARQTSKIYLSGIIMKQRNFKFYARFAFFWFLTMIPSLIYLITMGFLIENLLSLAILIGFVVAAIVGTIQIWNSYQIAFEIETQTINDISFWHKEPPASIQKPILELQSLGFERLGEFDVEMPGQPEPIADWVFNNDDGSIVAEIVSLGSEHLPFMLEFWTFFKGTRQVETYYPVGGNIRDTDFHFVGISDSIDAAYHYHIRQVGRFTEQYGEPMPVNSMERYFKLDRIQRKAFASRKLMLSTSPVFFQQAFIKLAVATMATGLLTFRGFPFFNSNFDAMPDMSVSILNLVTLFGSLLLTLAFAPRHRSIKKMKKQDKI